MTPQEIEQWISACNHEPAREVLRQAIRSIPQVVDKDTPKDRPILAWCSHEADPYHIVNDKGDPTGRLTIYGGHCEGMSHADDGWNVIVWGGGFTDTGEYGEVMAELPDWWFVHDSELERAANPVLWVELPEVDPEFGKRETFNPAHGSKETADQMAAGTRSPTARLTQRLWD